ncbi:MULTISPECIES: protein-glutamine gamma-glutamyltransferase [Paenibacillus]|uniref:protein-glutamine gamma-glutamyltransferase n=1 Tax=Paenibacillus TaxID=44249 RepID=UPI0022B8B6DC|nr:protein-glutamine gamma-glutamyltransferase [Paenibacillus caseinilyticus]MCZ8522302.1 protein-glutamine gamma-glutamyltransferase [Paenibacillus caseinilyticus]
MIVLPESSLSVSAAVQVLAPLEREIYEQKQRSPVVFEYPSLAALQFELRLRSAIVEAAVGLQESDAEFESFKESRCNEAYWTRTAGGGFRQRPEVRTSEAIRDIYKNGKAYAFECATAVIIVLYKAVLETIGEAGFDRLFRHLFLMSWHHDSLLHLITVYGKGEVYPGDTQYVKNPEVNPKVIEWQGENVIKLRGDAYFGHGVGIGRIDLFVNKLNRHRLPGSKVSAYLLDEATYPNFFALLEAAGAGQLPSYLPLLPVRSRGRIVSRIGTRTAIYL